ncbi:MAG TPA: hypothetical protein VHX37_06030 [Acidobacteriaceae bacterium]|jgi:hypothetical protein|nr:hypothetical protein [Acidobacteriaceae bacterium]
MANGEIGEKGSLQGATGGVDRRSFVKGAAAASLLGAGAAIAQSTGADSRPEAADPQVPAGLHPGAEPDCRFPEFYQTSVPGGMKLVTDYFAALSRRDLHGMAQTLQFPFLTYEGTQPVVVQTIDDLMSNPPPSMNVTGKGENLIKPGSYDIMEGIEMLLFNPIGAGFSLNFARYRADGHKILVCNALFGVTNNDGKWGIEYMSTIFQPAELSYESFDADAIAAALHTTQRDHALARKERDVLGLRTTVMFPIPTASVWIGGSTANAGAAREGRAMQPYHVKGVKSRIRVTDNTEDSILHPSADLIAQGEKSMAQFVAASGGPVGKWSYSLEFAGPRGKGTRVLFAGTDKGHIYSGYTRYTADGTMISETRFIGAVTYRRRIWAASDISGVFGQVMFQDHANDVLT